MLHSKVAVKWRGIGKKRLRRNTFDLLPGIPTDPERSSIDGDGRKHTHTHTHTHKHIQSPSILKH